MHDFPELVLKICHSHSNGLIIQNYKGPLIKEKKKLDRFIAELEIPTYYTFTRYHYMDILSAFSKKKFTYDFNRLSP